MTAKAYLGQARFLDMRIKSKIQQIESLNELATSCTAALSDMATTRRWPTFCARRTAAT